MDRRWDDCERRCPRLGGPVRFAYCRDHGGDRPATPCGKLFDCWWEVFDVAAYLRANLPAETVAQLLQRTPRPKVQSLLEMIARAQQDLDE
ncbi:MAG: hypothetical protein WAK57_08365 [Desulfobacterales bacterium]|jgi:hypothetical protein